jgi:hypothetical protein
MTISGAQSNLESNRQTLNNLNHPLLDSILENSDDASQKIANSDSVILCKVPWNIT